MRHIATMTLAVALTVFCGSFGCHNAGEEHDGDPSCDPRVNIKVKTEHGGFLVYGTTGLLGSSPTEGTIDGICRSASGLEFLVVVEAAATFTAKDANGQYFAVYYQLVDSNDPQVHSTTFSVPGPAGVIITVP